MHDSGEAGAFLFYLMPLFEGESLRDRIEREGALPIPDAVRWLRDVADALAYAHAHGVVHRDIKPGNVMLSGRHAVVTDFGVARTVVLLVAGLENQRGQPEVEPVNFLPHITVPVLMLNGRYNFYFPVETAQRPFFGCSGRRRSTSNW